MRMATCHPERKHKGRGLCSNCYKKWQIENVPGYREKHKAWNSKRKNYSHGNARFSRHGITRDIYEARYRQQNGLCAICNNPPAPDKTLVIDHDHNCCPGIKSCGKCFRSLLCRDCNLVLYFLEKFQREPGWVVSAQNYLLAFSSIESPDSSLSERVDAEFSASSTKVLELPRRDVAG
jgi:hypothetical protein